jgi:hypothetical protein
MLIIIFLLVFCDLIEADNSNAKTLSLLRRKPISTLLGKNKVKFDHRCQIICTLSLLFHQAVHHISPSLNFSDLLRDIANNQPEINEFLEDNPLFITSIKRDCTDDSCVDMDIFITTCWFLKIVDNDDLYSDDSNDGFIVVPKKRKYELLMRMGREQPLMIKKIFLLFLLPIDGLIGRDLRMLLKSEMLWEVVEKIHYDQPLANILLYVITARNRSFSQKLGELINSSFLNTFKEEEELSCRMSAANRNFRVNNFIMEEIVPFNNLLQDFLCPKREGMFFDRIDLIFCHFEGGSFKIVKISSTLSLAFGKSFLVSRSLNNENNFAEVIKLLKTHPFLAYYLMLRYEIGFYKVVAYTKGDGIVK